MDTISKRDTGEIKISPEFMYEIQKGITNIPSFQEKIEESFENRITETLEIILGGAITLGVSDIHIEPKKLKSRIRVRDDGMLQDVIDFNLDIYAKVVSRIKLISKLKLNIRDRPQDGRFSVALPENPGAAISKLFMVEIRVSILPSEYGETIVLRVLNPKKLVSFEQLGLRTDLLKLFEKEMSRPNGMVIVTGPTGSGKTTTLYAFLKKVQNSENKIITIEDPIEYHLEDISQTQVNPEKQYTFANGLRSVMRQDPDIILVGEIRDLETATIALQASLTGHLVFSTLHTNDAAGTIARLQSLGENLVNIAPAINLSIAQRLVRKVCKHCKKTRKITTEELKEIKENFKNFPKNIEKPKINSNLKIVEPVGCKECNFTGYKGRVGIFEALLIDDEMENFILTSPSIADLNKKAIKRGMTTIYQDGILKVLEGETTFEEVERVTGE